MGSLQGAGGRGQFAGIWAVCRGQFAGGRRQRFGQFSAESPLGGFRRGYGGRGQGQLLWGQGAVATAAEGYGSSFGGRGSVAKAAQGYGSCL